MLERLKGFIKPGSEEEKLVQQIDFSRLPRHVAIIMDGNGRWAERRNLPRIEGHRAGADSVREAVETCARLGIKVLTLYAFSKENWKRPKKEVTTLWRLLENYIRKEDKVLVKNKIRLMVIGDRRGIPDSTCQELERVEKLTRNYSDFVIVLALNYGGRSEIVDGVQKILKDNNLDPDSLDEELFSKYLYTAQLPYPDPDLVIRTSGEMRISNFLLWQVAYAELWITDVLWPDFRRKHMLQAVVDYQKRERRFGDIHSH
ncbi:MAG: isoprenyl transferase [Candidatus Aminicenantales bacterium]